MLRPSVYVFDIFFFTHFIYDLFFSRSRVGGFGARLVGRWVSWAAGMILRDF